MFDFEHKAVYLAGPMAGRKDGNRAEFAAAESTLYSLGARFVFNPCEYYRRGNSLPEWPRCEFIRHNLHMLTGGRPHRPNFDVLVLLDGWAHSDGAKAERSCAELCNIPILSLKDIDAAQIRAFWEDA